MKSIMLQWHACRDAIRNRLREPAPARIQFLTGPRQVGKTTLLLDLAKEFGVEALYTAADGPEAALPGFWEGVWRRAEETAGRRGRCVLLVDEIQHLDDWAARLKGDWDRLQRRRTPVHVVASSSSAIHLGAGSRESLAGRFERLTLAHWSAKAVAAEFDLEPREAAHFVVRLGGFPGAMDLRDDPPRWAAYVRDAIVEPAIGRDVLALSRVRRPALLRQIYALAASSPAQIVSLQKLKGRLQDPGALETIARYLDLLGEAYLLAGLPKYSDRPTRRRAAPPKLVPASNAFPAVVDPRGVPDPDREPDRFGAWVENACLAFLWNSGQDVAYWREEPLEVDAVSRGDLGSWAIEVKTGGLRAADLRGLAEFCRRYPDFRPLVVCREENRPVAERLGIPARAWEDFLLEGPP